MVFPRQEYWSGLPFPSPGDSPVSGIEPMSPALQVDSLPSEPPGKPLLPLQSIVGFCISRERRSRPWTPTSRHQTQMLNRLMTGVAVLKLCKRKIKQDLHEDIKPLLIPKTGGGGWISS